MGLSTLVMARTLFLTGNLTARIFGVDTFEGSEEHQGAEVIKKGRLFDIFRQTSIHRDFEVLSNRSDGQRGGIG